MITLARRASRERQRPEEPTRNDAGPPVAHAPGWPWLVLLVLVLGGYLLFAHGCHGDEDNELFARFLPLVQGLCTRPGG